jgi:hypothetical protein
VQGGVFQDAWNLLFFLIVSHCNGRDCELKEQRLGYGIKFVQESA